MKKLLAVVLLLGLMLCLSGCQSPAEKAYSQMKNTKITVDQNTVDQVQRGIDSYRNGN